jgi:hypothetical protein
MSKDSMYQSQADSIKLQNLQMQKQKFHEAKDMDLLDVY